MSVMTAKKAAAIDFSIVGVILAVVAGISFLSISTLPEYENPVEVSTEMLMVNDFVEEYSAGGAVLKQDSETGLITATVDGEPVGEILSSYLQLVVSENGDTVTYSLKQKVSTN